MIAISFIFIVLKFSFSFSKYILSFNLFLSDEYLFDIYPYSINKNAKGFYQNDFYYYGSIEKLTNLKIKQKSQGNTTFVIKNGNHPLVYISDENDIQYIVQFPITSAFIMDSSIKTDLEKLDKIKNYTLFTIDSFDFYYEFLFSDASLYYVVIGIDSEKLQPQIFCIILFCTIMSILISFILRKRIKRTNVDYLLPIHFLVYSISDLLCITNIISAFSYYYCKDKGFFFISEYLICFLYAFFKSILFTIIILLFDGWLTISFVNWGGKFKKISKFIFLFDLIFSSIIMIIIYFIRVWDKLKLFHFKNCLEYFSILCYIIYSIYKKLIPLIKQCNYEQRLRTDLVKCYNSKKRKYIGLVFIMLLYCCSFLYSIFLEYKVFYTYFYNFSIHIITQIGLETVFVLLISILFYPRKLPNYYKEDVIFNYKEKVFLLANIIENEENLNINNLNEVNLKKFSKKINFPIVFICPFTDSSKDSVYDELHIGFVQGKKTKTLLS